MNRRDRSYEAAESGWNSPGAASSVLVDRRRGLTLREQQVCELLATDTASKQIALVLGVSWGTVRGHLRHITVKLSRLGKIRPRGGQVAIAIWWDTEGREQYRKER